MKTQLNKKKMKVSKRIEETVYKTALTRVLRDFEIPSHYYSLNDYCDESVCIEEKQGTWIVYYAERGNKYELKEFYKLESAYFEMMGRLARDDEQLRRMISQYNTLKFASLQEIKSLSFNGMEYVYTPTHIGLAFQKSASLSFPKKEIAKAKLIRNKKQIMDISLRKKNDRNTK